MADKGARKYCTLLEVNAGEIYMPFLSLTNEMWGNNVHEPRSITWLIMILKNTRGIMDEIEHMLWKTWEKKKIRVDNEEHLFCSRLVLSWSIPCTREGLFRAMEIVESKDWHSIIFFFNPIAIWLLLDLILIGLTCSFSFHPFFWVFKLREIVKRVLILYL